MTYVYEIFEYDGTQKIYYIGMSDKTPNTLEEKEYNNLILGHMYYAAFYRNGIAGILYDLTENFGKGNEPKTHKEFEDKHFQLYFGSHYKEKEEQQ